MERGDGSSVSQIECEGAPETPGRFERFTEVDSAEEAFQMKRGDGSSVSQIE